MAERDAGRATALAGVAISPWRPRAGPPAALADPPRDAPAADRPVSDSGCPFRGGGGTGPARRGCGPETLRLAAASILSGDAGRGSAAGSAAACPPTLAGRRTARRAALGRLPGPIGLPPDRLSFGQGTFALGPGTSAAGAADRGTGRGGPGRDLAR